MIQILFSLILVAQADPRCHNLLDQPETRSIWSRIASRLRLSAPDPYQFETHMTLDLVRLYESYGIRGAWGRLSSDDAEMLNVMGGELRWRLQTGLSLRPEHEEIVIAALNAYEEFEGHAPYAKGRGGS